MNTNVGDMPIEIFGDYISDTLDQEWSWEYLFFADNGDGDRDTTYGHGNGCGNNERLNIVADDGLGSGSFTCLRSRKPLHRRCWQAKRPSGARETAYQPFRVGDEGDELKIASKLPPIKTE